jgi:hypothetical protein
VNAATFLCPVQQETHAGGGRLETDEHLFDRLADAEILGDVLEGEQLAADLLHLRAGEVDTWRGWHSGAPESA